MPWTQGSGECAEIVIRDWLFVNRTNNEYTINDLESWRVHTESKARYG